jgi:hypothetical protein
MNLSMGTVLCRIVPNVLILGASGFLLFATELFLIPNLMATHWLFGKLWGLISLCILAAYMMGLWCWIQLIAFNPGRVSDDLNRRGFLRRVLRGDIPRSLQHLPICVVCFLPRPPPAPRTAAFVALTISAWTTIARSPDRVSRIAMSSFYPQLFVWSYLLALNFSASGYHGSPAVRGSADRFPLNERFSEKVKGFVPLCRERRVSPEGWTPHDQKTLNF